MPTHRMTRRGALRWLSAGSGLALLAACGSPAPAAPPTAVPQSASKPTSSTPAVAPIATTAPTTAASGLLQWAVLGVPATLDPFVTTDPNATVLLRALHAPLVDFKPDGSMVPNLASDWKAEPTGWTVRIRDGAKFSPVSADDLKASFDFWTDSANKYPVASTCCPTSRAPRLWIR